MLPRLRNKFVFHFDDQVARATLPTLDFAEFVFAEGLGRAKGQVYYELADSVAINFLLAGLEDLGATEEERMRRLLKQVGVLAVETLNAGEALLVDLVSEMGWRVELAQGTSGPPDGQRDSDGEV